MGLQALGGGFIWGADPMPALAPQSPARRVCEKPQKVRQRCLLPTAMRAFDAKLTPAERSSGSRRLLVGDGPPSSEKNRASAQGGLAENRGTLLERVLMIRNRHLKDDVDYAVGREFVVFSVVSSTDRPCR